MSEVQTQESASPETENLASFVSRELNEEQTHEEAETDNEGEYRPNKRNFHIFSYFFTILFLIFDFNYRKL